VQTFPAKFLKSVLHCVCEISTMQPVYTHKITTHIRQNTQYLSSLHAAVAACQQLGETIAVWWLVHLS